VGQRSSSAQPTRGGGKAPGGLPPVSLAKPKSKFAALGNEKVKANARPKTAVVRRQDNNRPTASKLEA